MLVGLGTPMLRPNRARHCTLRFSGGALGLLAAQPRAPAQKNGGRNYFAALVRRFGPVDKRGQVLDAARAPVARPVPELAANSDRPAYFARLA